MSWRLVYTIQDRLAYKVLDDIKTVKVIRMWTHYE